MSHSLSEAALVRLVDTLAPYVAGGPVDAEEGLQHLDHSGDAFWRDLLAWSRRFGVALELDDLRDRLARSTPGAGPAERLVQLGLSPDEARRVIEGLDAEDLVADGIHAAFAADGPSQTARALERLLSLPMPVILAERWAARVAALPSRTGFTAALILGLCVLGGIGGCDAEAPAPAPDMTIKAPEPPPVIDPPQPPPVPDNTVVAAPPIPEVTAPPAPTPRPKPRPRPPVQPEPVPKYKGVSV